MAEESFTIVSDILNQLTINSVTKAETKKEILAVQYTSQNGNIELGINPNNSK